MKWLVKWILYMRECFKCDHEPGTPELYDLGRAKRVCCKKCGYTLWSM